jgi:hypothetical protein
MKRKTILTLGAAATAAVIGAIAIPAIAGGWGPHDGWGPRQMMQRGGHGPMGMTGMADNPVYQSFDADEDGTVTAAELEAGIAALHTEHDGDGNGALSSDEFAALFAEVTRDMAERPFTMLDANDDGEISAEEMAFPAQMMARMQRMHGADAEQQ